MKISKRVVNVNPSATLSITARAAELKSQGIDVISLAAGQPDFDTPQHICAAAHQALDAGQTRYAPSSGIPALRQAISEKFINDNKLSYGPEQIVVSNGAKHSLYNIFQAIIDPGDEVIIPSPYWVSYPEMIKLASGKALIVDTDYANQFRITPEQLRQAITERTRAFILNSPSNPTGMSYNAEQLQALAEVLLEFPNVAIISDEIYEKLTYDGFEHHSIAALVPELYDRTFTVNGFSKTYCMTGWRLGYIGCPDLQTADALKRIQDQSTSGVTTFAQFGAVAAIKESQDCLVSMHADFDARRQYLVRALNNIAGVECLQPQGAFYVFPNVSAWKIPSFELAMRLLDEAHVALVPGSAFGAEGFVRLSFATSIAELQEAIARLEKWVAKNITI